MLKFIINKDIALTAEHILVELEIPLMLTCRDGFGNLYLGLCIEDEPDERYLFIQTTESNVIDMMTNKITMRDVFLIDPTKPVWYYSYGKDSIKDVCDNIIEDNLPENEYFGNINDRLKQYVESLKLKVPESAVVEYYQEGNANVKPLIEKTFSTEQLQNPYFSYQYNIQNITMDVFEDFIVTCVEESYSFTLMTNQKNDNCFYGQSNFVA